MQDLADFDDAVLGLALPPAAEAVLQQAAALRHDPGAQQAVLARASQLAPGHPAVLIARYRAHFYGHRLEAARDVARSALALGAAALGLPAQWTEVAPQPLAGARHDPATRFWLFALKGLAYLDLRLGALEEAGRALALLRALDPQDRVGAAVLDTVLQRALRSGDDDEDILAEAAHG